MRPIVYQGKVVSIDHLAPFLFTCKCDDLDRDLVIEANFANHCYTCGFDPAKHSKEDIILWEGGKEQSRARVFNSERHSLSIQLPGIILGLPDAKINQTTQHRNYIYSVPLNINGDFYDVFFMLQRAGKDAQHDLRLTVESAYRKTHPIPLPKRPRSIRFRVLAYKVLRNQPVRFAPR